jgi:hypothetical protein
MADNQMLLIEWGSAGPVEISLNESANPNGRVRFRGKFQEAEAVNKNKRMYPYDVLSENVKRLQESLEEGALQGELDHPTDSIVHLTNISHKITKLWWEGNVLMGEGEILTTPAGKVLRALINDGVRIGISSRGVGNGHTNEDGILVIGESYRLITFDAVADPSTYHAFQKEVVGNKRENHVPQIPVNNSSEIASRSIYKPGVTKEQVLAAFGSIVKTQLKDVKARLNNG